MLLKTSERSIKIPTIHDKPVTVLRPLTSEERKDILSQYDLKNMKVNSEDYCRLMNKLCNLGVISDTPISFDINTFAGQIDENGKVVYMLAKADEVKSTGDLTSWISQSIDINKDRYNNLLKQDTVSQVDKMFMTQFESFGAIKDVLKELY